MAACAATLAVLVIAGSVQVWQIYLLATVLGIAAAVDNPTGSRSPTTWSAPRCCATPSA